MAYTVTGSAARTGRTAGAGRGHDAANARPTPTGARVSATAGVGARRRSHTRVACWMTRTDTGRRCGAGDCAPRRRPSSTCRCSVLSRMSGRSAYGFHGSPPTQVRQYTRGRETVGAGGTRTPRWQRCTWNISSARTRPARVTVIATRADWQSFWPVRCGQARSYGSRRHAHGSGRLGGVRSDTGRGCTATRRCADV